MNSYEYSTRHSLRCIYVVTKSVWLSVIAYNWIAISVLNPNNHATL
uniref:Uncharacterized protein n=1 Tax=Arundo donax TaxID=35708 RepID=A0A0A8Z362_ARUDO